VIRGKAYDHLVHIESLLRQVRIGLHKKLLPNRGWKERRVCN